MINKITTIIFALILSSCGNGNNGPIEAGNIGLGQELSGTSALEGNSKETALRICYAYRSKRIGFRTNHLDASFSFSVSNRPCESSESNKTISVTLKEVLQSQPMTFDSSERSLTYFSTVNTDEDGNLASICEKLLKGDNSTNKISESGGVLKIAEFSVGTASDHYTVLEATENGDTYTVQKRTVYYVQTANQTSPQVGDDYNIEHQEACPDGSANDQFIIEQSTTSYP